MEKSIVEKYWHGVLSRLQIEVNTFNELIGHAGEMGRENEQSLARILENLLPPSLGVGTGIIIDSHGNRSKQTDIIVFDRSAQPQIMAQTSQMIFPIEVVRCAIEIKTTLRASDVDDLAKKCKSLRDLSPIANHEMPKYLLFAYTCDSVPTQAERLGKLEGDEAPDAFCVVDPGIIGRPHGTPRIGYATVLDNAEPPMPIKPPEDADDPFTIDGTQYPVFTTGAYGRGDRYAGDPARALLLFCGDLLYILGDSVSGDWLKAYLSLAATHLVPIRDK
ncbi:DUF6602 domain-containing protein [Promicromonospora sukumoe]